MLNLVPLSFPLILTIRRTWSARARIWSATLRHDWRGQVGLKDLLGRASQTTPKRNVKLDQDLHEAEAVLAAASSA
ncbi:hypothetical protein BJV78DRAFT_1258463, partial [Lactifluus subvellereus]